ncbi:unnamed protein product [Soboliphyme baturini]|uniref:FLYWCH-type domain-containing protein n=1 Tax=Soboliphyme baturini TaxID=241478 RepID=A0A183IP25_9BILA|nr:unnamed protein product [Soboliphyme baturini]
MVDNYSMARVENVHRGAWMEVTRPRNAGGYRTVRLQENKATATVDDEGAIYSFIHAAETKPLAEWRCRAYGKRHGSRHAKRHVGGSETELATTWEVDRQRDHPLCQREAKTAAATAANKQSAPMGRPDERP